MQIIPYTGVLNLKGLKDEETTYGWNICQLWGKHLICFSISGLMWISVSVGLTTSLSMTPMLPLVCSGCLWTWCVCFPLAPVSPSTPSVVCKHGEWHPPAAWPNCHRRMEPFPPHSCKPLERQSQIESQLKTYSLLDNASSYLLEYYNFFMNIRFSPLAC